MRRSRLPRPRLLPLSGESGRPRSFFNCGPDVVVGESEENRKGVDALGEVLADWLSEVLLGPDDVEDVVADLEDHPECCPNRVRDSISSAVRPEVMAPTRHAVAISADRLARDRLEIVGLRPVEAST